MNDKLAYKICKLFNVEMKEKENITIGLINFTYKITSKDNKLYILQEISPIFKDVPRLMSNIEKVTEHIKNKVILEGGDISRNISNLLKNVENNKSFVSIADENGIVHYYRMFDYISNSSTYIIADVEKLREAGKAFGKFQRQLADFPAEDLSESLPNFHNTFNRFTNCIMAIDETLRTKSDDFIKEITPQIDFVLKNAIYSKIFQSKEIVCRVVHNDTKLNNVMFDKLTNKAICVVDLDTVMPGTILSDYGDAIRYCGNSTTEDDVDLNNVKINWANIEAFTDGFMSEMALCLTNKEIKLLPISPMVFSYELGLRFFTDFLTGNKYFRCNNSTHNLDRARNQFELAELFKNNLPKMEEIINQYYLKYK